MLVLSRRIGEAIVIGDRVRVHVAGVRGNAVRLAITAPDSVRILRQELHCARHEFESPAAPLSSLFEEAARTKHNFPPLSQGEGRGEGDSPEVVTSPPFPLPSREALESATTIRNNSSPWKAAAS